MAYQNDKAERFQKSLDHEEHRYAYGQKLQNMAKARAQADHSPLIKDNMNSTYMVNLWRAQDRVLTRAFDQCARATFELRADHNNCRYLLRLRDHLLVTGRPLMRVGFGDNLEDPTVPDEHFAPSPGWVRVI